MFFSLFSTREIVSALYLLIFIVFIITKKSIRSSLLNVIKAFFCFKIQVPIFLLLLYGSIPVLVAKQFSFWKWIYIKDIIIWLIFAGVPGCLNVSDAKEQSHFMKIVIEYLSEEISKKLIIL